MPTLYTYCLPHDTGAAPNPFWGICTLVICKPKIRLAAKVGDWVVGTGPVKSPIGNLKGRVVYAMEITQKMTMLEYDNFTKKQLPQKIPDFSASDKQLRVGDSIYDFSHNPDHPRLRKSVHCQSEIETDLGGQYALLSKHFFYFGDQALLLPKGLIDNIVIQRRGYRSHKNDPYVERFLDWLNNLNLKPNHLYGNPFSQNNLIGACIQQSC
ncbi:MAG: hypothetical protein RM338_03805 [Nostoc sp. DedQUE12a]|nr:hypothetical protein [Nostoc sp. DedQUE12a]